MKSLEPSPPGWAEAVLQSLLRPADRESISGDLLEEYRAGQAASSWNASRERVVHQACPQRALASDSAVRTDHGKRDTPVIDVQTPLVWQRRASSWRLVTGRSHLSVGRLPRLPEDSPDQDGNTGRRQHQSRGIHDIVRGRRDPDARPAHVSNRPSRIFAHFVGVAAHGARLRCCDGMRRCGRRSMRAVRAARGAARLLAALERPKSNGVTVQKSRFNLL